jgi:hypothetical protein
MYTYFLPIQFLGPMLKGSAASNLSEEYFWSARNLAGSNSNGLRKFAVLRLFSKW